MRLAVASLLVLMSAPAFAHSGHGGGFAAGFAHPSSGADHVLAMLAVGLWAAMRGDRAIWAWPAAFVGAMIAGFGLSQANVAIPMLEPMIISTVIMLGSVIAFGLSAPILAGASLIALAGLTHGFAHGLEAQGAFLSFGAGFTAATMLLHAAGLGIGLAAVRMSSWLPLRLAGAGIAAAGIALATIG